MISKQTQFFFPDLNLLSFCSLLYTELRPSVLMISFIRDASAFKLLHILQTSYLQDGATSKPAPQIIAHPQDEKGTSCLRWQFPSSALISNLYQHDNHNCLSLRDIRYQCIVRVRFWFDIILTALLFLLSKLYFVLCRKCLHTFARSIKSAFSILT